MPDAALAKLLSLLDADTPADLRRAAILVLGEMPPDRDIGQALFERLDDPEPAVRADVIRALGKLHFEKATSRLIDRIEQGGEESELAAQAVGHMGSKGAKALQDLMTRVAPGLRRRIAGALGAGGTASAESAAVDSLLDSDPGVVEAATRSLIAKAPALSPSHRKAMIEHLLPLLAGKKKLAPVSETAAVRLLAAFDDPRIGKILWERVAGKVSPEQRAAILQALGKWCKEPSRDQVKKLLACAGDADFRIAAPALMLLQNVNLGKATGDWLALFRAPDGAVRRFAIEKLGKQDTADAARALFDQVRHPDAGLRDEALKALGNLKQGRKLLLEGLEDAESPDEAWRLARAQVNWATELSSAARKKLLELALKYLEKGDRRHDALLFLLRHADGKAVEKSLQNRAEDFRKKKNYEKALLYLRQLLRDPACSVDVRLEAIGCGLRQASHDLAPEAWSGDPALQQLARLVPNYEGECLEYLQSARWLTPEDLFYAGFHFAEQHEPLRRFGGKLLHLVVKKAGKGKIAKDARAKILSNGLEK